MAVALIAACGEERRTAGGGGGGGGTRRADARAGLDGAREPSDGEISTDAREGGDASGIDGGAIDAGGLDGGRLDASISRDATSPQPDAWVTVDATPAPDASAPPAGDLRVTTTCGADFGGDVVVSYNGSLGVGSLRGFNLVASLQFQLNGQTGTIQLGTAHRIRTGIVVNLVTHSTWTNISQDPEVVSGNAPDTISGTLVVRSYQPASGIADIELVNVRLQNASDLSFCTVNGTVRTSRLGR